jgi:hypothetical protein
VAAGERKAVLAIHVERVFDDVVALDADRVNEQRAGEVGKAEAVAHFGAVDHEGSAGDGQRLAPFGELRAVLAEEAEPEFGLLGSVQAPIVGAGDAGVNAIDAVQALLLAHQREVGGEVHRVEIVRLVRQHVVGQADVVEGGDARTLREEMLQRRENFRGVEEKHEHGLRARCAKLAHRLRVVAEEGGLQVFDALHVIAGDVEFREIVIGVEAADGVGRIVDRDGPGICEVFDQRMGLRRRKRMAERLEERGAAGVVARPPAVCEVGVLEGFDLKGHDRALSMRLQRQRRRRD